VVELVFTEDIRKANGEIKFHAGQSRDWDKGAWNGIARSLGRPLEDFTVPKVEANAVAAEAIRASGGRRKAAKTAASPPPKHSKHAVTRRALPA